MGISAETPDELACAVEKLLVDEKVRAKMTDRRKSG